jgi:coenzyme F420 biosynthesis associated uncharacterized protein
MIDWDLAVATANRLVPAGPAVSYEEAAAVVGQLRELAHQAEGDVRAFPGMVPAVEPEPVTVVDRPGWVRANIDGFRVVLEPLTARLLERRRSTPGGGMVVSLGSKVTGVQVGSILAYLATRVLGQYELFLPPTPGGDGSTGRMTLVAPNVVAVERALGVDPHDFRLWVCLHEVTHRTQFTAVPWLRAHVQSEISAFIEATDLDPAALRARLSSVARAVTDSVRGRQDGVSLLEAVQTPEQKVVLDRLTALMSLAEGHGEYVMDGVGPGVVPTVDDIRRKFDLRRQATGPVERMIRRLFGLDLKMRQYAEGQHFVRAVVASVGMAGFNRVWESPQTLPTRSEILDPDAWVERIHGRRAVTA